MITVGGSTPYTALYGRVPRILLGIDQINFPDEGSRGDLGTIAHTTA